MPRNGCTVFDPFGEGRMPCDVLPVVCVLFQACFQCEERLHGHEDGSSGRFDAKAPEPQIRAQNFQRELTP